MTRPCFLTTVVARCQGYLAIHHMLVTCVSPQNCQTTTHDFTQSAAQNSMSTNDSRLRYNLTTSLTTHLSHPSHTRYRLIISDKCRTTLHNLPISPSLHLTLPSPAPAIQLLPQANSSGEDGHIYLVGNEVSFRLHLTIHPANMFAIGHAFQIVIVARHWQWQNQHRATPVTTFFFTLGRMIQRWYWSFPFHICRCKAFEPRQHTTTFPLWF